MISDDTAWTLSGLITAFAGFLVALIGELWQRRGKIKRAHNHHE